VTPETVLSFTPRSAAEAAEIFRACGAAAAAGRAVRAGVIESPFRPSEGFETPRAQSSIGEIGAAGAAAGADSRVDSATGASGAATTRVLVSHEAMREIHEMSRNDFLAVAGGGVRFGAFVEEARRAGLYFPHEPDVLTRHATIAELVMGAEIFGTDGHFGNLREYVLALEIVTPAGEIIRTGSRAVKDVAGYNIAGFLMGGGGLCGMISKATLRLLPPPGTRTQFLCMGSRMTLEKLAEEIHRKLAPAIIELFPYTESPDERSNLIGELQSAVPGRDEALLAEVAALAPAEASVERLEPTSLEAFKHFPMLAMKNMKKGQRLLHTALGAHLPAAHRHDIWARESFFPKRFHYYFAADSSAAPEVCAAAANGAVDSIEMRGERIYRRRFGRDEIAKLAGGRGGTGAAAREAAESTESGGAGAPSGARELTMRIQRVFDPHGIMLP
jgi:FAD/FMN-containing dehydrogenase